MTSVDQEKIAQLYAKLRRESLVTGSVPVTVRQIESIVRIAEAHARMHLRDFVNDDDINVAIQIVLQSFIDAQKYGIMRTMKKVCFYFILKTNIYIYIWSFFSRCFNVI